VQEKGWVLKPGAAAEIAIVNNYNKISPLVSLYSVEKYHLNGFRNLYVLLEVLAKARMGRG
jgi:hypothetical protein